MSCKSANRMPKNADYSNNGGVALGTPEALRMPADFRRVLLTLQVERVCGRRSCAAWIRGIIDATVRSPEGKSHSH